MPTQRERVEKFFGDLDSVYDSAGLIPGLKEIDQDQLLQLVKEAVEAETEALRQQLDGARRLGLLAIFEADALGEDSVVSFAEEETRKIKIRASVETLREVSKASTMPAVASKIRPWLRFQADEMEKTL